MSPLTCPQGHPVDIVGSRFCATCGASLEGAPSPRDAPACALHPERLAAEPCPRCGTFSCEECLVSVTSDFRLCPGCRKGELEIPLPWDRRQEMGVLRAYFKTASSLLLSPNRTLEGARSTGTLGSSLLFDAISSFVGILTTALLYGLFIGGIGVLAAVAQRTETNTSAAPGILAGVGLGMVLFTVLGSVLLGLGWRLLGAALDHLVLMLVGAQPRSFETTLRASALSQAPALCGLVPFCGAYVLIIWPPILRIFLYRAFHRTTTGKAALGALLVPGVLIFLGGAIYIVVLALVGLGASK